MNGPRSSPSNSRDCCSRQKLEPGFWDSSNKADADSVEKLKANGMKIMVPSKEMMGALRDRTKPQLEAFLKKVPAAKEPDHDVHERDEALSDAQSVTPQTAPAWLARLCSIMTRWGDWRRGCRHCSGPSDIDYLSEISVRMLSNYIETCCWRANGLGIQFLPNGHCVYWPAPQ